MAAFDTPLSITSEPMITPGAMTEVGSPKGAGGDAVPATIAPFAPVKTSSFASPQNTVIIHQKSPLLVATPPQVTRALAYSHPFLLPLNQLLGLISWSSGDPWESFLFLCSFWATVLYGDVLIVFAGPIVLVAGLMIGMYSRRFSPLSSSFTSSTGGKDHRRTGSNVVSANVGGGSAVAASAANSDVLRHQKSLDNIVDTLNTMTLRCNTLLEPFLKMTDFLSTQYTATSASTRPALVRLLMRMLGVLPVWIILSLHPIHLITGRRVVFVVGTLIFTWHSKPARVCRTLLWRSRTVRRASNILTGLEFPGTTPAEVAEAEAGTKRPGPFRRKSQRDAANHLAASTAASHRGQAGVRFNFSLFENQRRWIGVGWTTTLLAYERANWTDEHLNACPSKDSFQLPKVDGGASGAWRWVPGSEWHVEPVEKDGQRKGKFAPSTVSLRGRGGDDEGWVYYDNNWAGGRAQDGWGRYTRRRKWVREAELVEVGDDDNNIDGDRPSTAGGDSVIASELPADELDASRTSGRANSTTSEGGAKKRRSLFGRRSSNKSLAKKSDKSGGSGDSTFTESDKSARRLNDDGEDERGLKKENWDVGDDAKMVLG